MLSSSLMASIPGREPLAIYSKVAPPPLEIFLKLLVKPKLLTADIVSPPPITTVAEHLRFQKCRF